MVDHRDLAGLQALDQVLGLAARAAHRAAIGGAGGLRAWISGPRRNARARLRRCHRAGESRCGESAGRTRGLRGREAAPRSRGGSRPRRRARRRACGRSRRPARRRRRARPSAVVAPSTACFSIRKWVAASEATWGRWVMQITWRPRRAARSRSPTARAVLPPMPASISSKTSVVPRRRCARPVSASITRESSPPEAASRSGETGIPGFVATRNSTVSAPFAPKPSGCGSSATSSRAPSIASSASSAGDPLRRARRRPRCRAAVSFDGRARPRRLGRREAPLQLAGALLGVLEPLDLGAAALGVLEHRLDRAAVLALRAGRAPSSRSSTSSSRPGSASIPSR